MTRLTSIGRVVKFVARIAGYFSFLVLLVGVFGILYHLWNLSEIVDPQGHNNDYCTSFPLRSVPNGKGLIATAHDTACDVLGGNSAEYIYVHKEGEVDSPQSLVFRYFFEGGTVGVIEKPLKMEWTDVNTLRISVGDVSEVTKALPELNGVQLSYVIGTERYPRTAWQDEVNKNKKYVLIEAVVCFLMILVLIYVAKRMWVDKKSTTTTSE